MGKRVLIKMIGLATKFKLNLNWTNDSKGKLLFVEISAKKNSFINFTSVKLVQSFARNQVYQLLSPAQFKHFSEILLHFL